MEESFLTWHLQNAVNSTWSTVDGRNPAPVDVVDIPVFIGFYTSQVVVWDFWTINSSTHWVFWTINSLSQRKRHQLPVTLPSFPYTSTNLTWCPVFQTLGQIAKGRIAEQTIDLSGIQAESKWCSCPCIVIFIQAMNESLLFSPCAVFRWVHILLMVQKSGDHQLRWQISRYLQGCVPSTVLIITCTLSRMIIHFATLVGVSSQLMDLRNKISAVKVFVAFVISFQKKTPLLVFGFWRCLNIQGTSLTKWKSSGKWLTLKGNQQNIQGPNLGSIFTTHLDGLKNLATKRLSTNLDHFIPVQGAPPYNLQLATNK